MLVFVCESMIRIRCEWRWGWHPFYSKGVLGCSAEVGLRNCFTPPITKYPYVNHHVPFNQPSMDNGLTLKTKVLGTDERVMYVFNRLEVFDGLWKRRWWWGKWSCEEKIFQGFLLVLPWHVIQGSRPRRTRWDPLDASAQQRRSTCGWRLLRYTWREQLTIEKDMGLLMFTSFGKASMCVWWLYLMSTSDDDAHLTSIHDRSTQKKLWVSLCRSEQKFFLHTLFFPKLTQHRQWEPTWAPCWYHHQRNEHWQEWFHKPRSWHVCEK